MRRSRGTLVWLIAALAGAAGAAGAAWSSPVLQADGTTASAAAIRGSVALVPQSLQSALRYGITVRVTASQAADGFATLSISRAAANRAHIATGSGLTVILGHGTVAGLRAGTVRLRLHVRRTMAARIRVLKHVVLSLRLQLVTANDRELAVEAAGSY